MMKGGDCMPNYRLDSKQHYQSSNQFNRQTKPYPSAKTSGNLNRNTQRHIPSSSLNHRLNELNQHASDEQVASQVRTRHHRTRPVSHHHNWHVDTTISTNSLDDTTLPKESRSNRFTNRVWNQTVHSNSTNVYTQRHGDRRYESTPRQHSRCNTQFTINRRTIEQLPQGKVKLLAVYVIICVVAWYASWKLMPFHNVNHLNIVGTDAVTAKEIASATGIKSYSKIKEVLDNESTYSDIILKTHPLISKVYFQRQNWQSMTIQVVEHKVVAKRLISGVEMPVLDSGQNVTLDSLLRAGMTVSMQSLPMLLNFDNNQGKLTELTRVLGEMDTAILSQIVSITLAEDGVNINAIDVQMVDGNLVKAITPTFNEKMTYYSQIVQQLNEKTGIINLKVGAYYAPFNNETKNVKLNTNLDNE